MAFNESALKHLAQRRASSLKNTFISEENCLCYNGQELIHFTALIKDTRILIC